MKVQTKGSSSVVKSGASAKRPTPATKIRRKAVTEPPAKPEVRIFVSYSHKDAAAQEKLHTHLAPWRHDDVTVWYDENIDPGAELGPEIARKLRQAHIFVALFSPNYFDSNYCWKIEYPRAMGRRVRKLMRVVAVVVKPCSWKQTPAAGFKLLPKDGREPERWPSADAAYVNVAEGIGRLIKTVRAELVAVAREQPGKVAKPALAKSSPVGKKPAKAKATAAPKRLPKTSKRASPPKK